MAALIMGSIGIGFVLLCLFYAEKWRTEREQRRGAGKNRG
jgi:hypothetical protein